MGTISKGILGPISGKVGTVVGGSWKGIAYLRSQPIKKKRKSTVDQLDVQLRFSLMINFVSTMTDLLKLTYKKYATDMSEANAAFAYNYHNAITGTTPDYEIDFSKALVSRGNLSNATAPAATVTGTQVFFTWTDNSGLGNASATDKAILVAFCKGMNLTIFTANSINRSAGSATLDVSNFLGQTIQTWVAFVSEDGEEASNSFYTGELTVTD